MWWALIEEIAPRAEEMAGEKEIACCVRGYHVYKDIWAAAIWEVLVCSTEPINVGTIFVVKLYSRKIFSYVFCVATKIFLRRIAFYALASFHPLMFVTCIPDRAPNGKIEGASISNLLIMLEVSIYLLFSPIRL